jgi:nucleoid-associated protein YgaU
MSIVAPFFSFDVDPDRDLISVILSGFFLPQDIIRLEAARADAHHKLRCGANQHQALIDVRQMHPHRPDVLALFVKLLTIKDLAAKRTAYVVTRSDALMQIKRATDGSGARYFMSTEAAADWLVNE